jgi:hypothetical protein
MNMDNVLRIKDFYSSALLRSLNIPLLSLENSQQRKIIFVFQISKDKGEHLLKEFWNRKLLVEPRKFIENINELKTRIHEVLQNN